MSDAPLHAAIVRAAMTATGASSGRVLAVEGDELRVAASAGAGGDSASDDARYVVESGQPLALVHADAGPVLCVPCSGGDGVVGALELRRALGEQGFGLDAVNVATLIGDVAGAALASGPGSAPAPAPAELAAELARLAESDPARYATVASLLGALLGHG